MKSGVKDQILAMRDNLKGGEGSASVQIGRREYYSVNFCLIRVSKRQPERQSWHVQQAARLTSFMTPSSELWRGANWCGWRRRLIVLCRKSGACSCLSGHWSLITIFPRAFEAFSVKDMPTGGLFFPGSYQEDAYWHVQRGGPVSDKLYWQVATKWRGAIYITTIKLLVLKVGFK